MFPLNISEVRRITCEDGNWDKNFPKCHKLCQKKKISGFTIRATCERDGRTVDCIDSNMLPNTTATLKCANGYQTYHQSYNVLVCLDDGTWSADAFVCSPVCGVIPNEATPYIVGGTVANITEIPWQVT